VKSCVPPLTNFKITVGVFEGLAEMVDRSQGCDSAAASASDGGEGRGGEGWDLPTALGQWYGILHL
jgi:hypothetical protein